MSVPPFVRQSARALRASAQFVLHRLPGDSKVTGSPRQGVRQSREWWEAEGQKLGAGWQTIMPAGESRLREPLYLESELPAAFIQAMQFPLHETFVLTLPKGRVFGQYAAVITPDDAILGDVSLEVDQFVTKDIWKPQLLTKVKLPKLQRTGETVAVLSSYWGDGFYHWFFEALPRLELLRRAGVTPDKYVVNADKKFQLESLELMGIPREKWVVAGPKLHLEAAQLLVPSLPAWMGTLPRWSSEFLRAQILPQITTAPRRRLYISRQKAGRRKLSNPEEIEPLLRDYGFETVFLEEMTVAQQAATLAGAEAVVAPHGAGLSNLVFCPPGTPVIELFSPHYLVPAFWNVAVDNDLKYGIVVGEDTGGSDDPTRHPDTLVNPEKLEAALQNWIGRKS